MTTSGATLWQLNRDQLIAASMRKLGVLAKGQTPDATDLTNGTIAINAVMAELQAIGMPLWARNEYTFGLTAGTSSYLIGVGQTLNTPFPLKVQQAILIDTLSQSTLDMNVVTIYEYNQMSPLGSSGQPVQLCYQPLVNYGKLTVWPTPDASSASGKTIKIIYQRPFEDVVSSTDTLDFPKEWHQTIIYKTAGALGPEYGIPLQDVQALLQQAEMHQQTALSFGTDESSIFFQVDRE